VAVGQDLFRFPTKLLLPQQHRPRLRRRQKRAMQSNQGLIPPNRSHRHCHRRKEANQEESKEFTTPSALATFAAAKGLRGTRTG
jgi:hypothetical protein